MFRYLLDSPVAGRRRRTRGGWCNTRARHNSVKCGLCSHNGWRRQEAREMGLQHVQPVTDARTSVRRVPGVHCGCKLAPAARRLAGWLADCLARAVESGEPTSCPVAPAVAAAETCFHSSPDFCAFVPSIPRTIPLTGAPPVPLTAPDYRPHTTPARRIARIYVHNSPHLRLESTRTFNVFLFLRRRRRRLSPDRETR